MKYTSDGDLPAVTGGQFKEAVTTMRPYTALVLKATPTFQPPGPSRSPAVSAIIVEHAKRNYALYLAKLLRVVCPIADGSGVTGISIFDASPEDVDLIMREDPAVKAGLFSYEIHPTRTFPIGQSSAGLE
jgi:hypothetical protein